MTVANNGSRSQYTATASQTVFPYTFEVFAKEDIAVVQNGTLLSEGTNYTVSGVGNDNGGNITLLVGATAGDTITIYRDMDLERLVDYQQSGDFLAQDVNDDFDRLWLALSQEKSTKDLAIRAPIDDAVLNSSNTELANVATRAGKALGFSPTGELSYLSSAVPDSTYKYFSTVAAAQADSNLTVGGVIQIGERANALFDVISGTGTANAFNIIAHGSLNQSLKLRQENHQYNVVAWGADPSEVADSRPAIQAIVDDIGSGGGDVIFPTGKYRITGVAGDDSHNNGILIPWQGVFTEDPKIRFLGVGNAEIRCYTANTIMFRASRPGVEFQDLILDGRGLAGVWGVGGVAEDRDQTAEIKSQSYQRINRCHFQECEEGYVLEPSASVSGSDSGAFYPVITTCTFNQCVRDIWFKGCSAAAIAQGGADGALSSQNRVTRANVAFCRLERGNVGIDLEYSTEATLLGNNFQFFNSGSDPSSGTGPKGTNQSAIALGAETENTYIIGGNAEACTWIIDNSATALNNMVYGFALTGVGNNLGTLPALVSNQIRLANNIKGANAVTSVTFKNNDFVELIADSAGTGTKDFVIETNGVQRYRTFNGTSTFSDNMVFQGNVDVEGKLNYGAPPIEVVAANAITPDTSFIELDCSGASCTLNTINGGTAGDVIYIKPRAAPSRVPTVADGVGNIQLNGNWVPATSNDTLTLIFNGTNWIETSRSLN